MRLQAVLFCTCLLGLLSGCQSVWTPAELTGLRSTGGRENPVVDDPWVRRAGDVARTEHPPEEINDPLGLRNIFTSEKAREIERNVGVGD